MNVIGCGAIICLFKESFRYPASSEISDLRNFWLHTMYASTELCSTYQIRW